MLVPMAVQISIDLEHATFADLVALVDAARVAGVTADTALELEESTLSIAVEPGTTDAHQHRVPERTREGEGPTTVSTPGSSALPQLGDAAIRSVVDILTGRQEPPRR